MITRSILIFTLALLLGTSTTVIYLLHTRNANFSTFDDESLARARWESKPPLQQNSNLPEGNKTGVTVDDKTIEFTTSFTFPSPVARIKYYMGDWLGRKLHPENIPCHEITAVAEVISDQPVLWSASKMEQAIKTNFTREWMIRAYLINAYDVVTKNRGTEEDEEDPSFILFFGDSHSRNTKLPVVAKTRFSRYATERSTGEPFFHSIIWPLEMHRHYHPVNQYIKLEREGQIFKWKDKKPTLIWRGGVTGIESDKNLSTTYPDGGPRLQVISTYFTANTSDVDVAFQRGNPSIQRVPHKYRNVKNFVRESDTSMVDQLKYKYILMLEGNDVATGLKWQLASNSVVFMAKPTTVSFLMEDLLVPFIHYVPLKDDYSNLIEMVHWARRNDKKCKWISEQATSYMQRLWMSKRAKEENADIKRNLGEIYQRQFGKAAKSCAKKFLSSVDEFGNRMVQFH